MPPRSIGSTRTGILRPRGGREVRAEEEPVGPREGDALVHVRREMVNRVMTRDPRDERRPVAREPVEVGVLQQAQREPPRVRGRVRERGHRVAPPLKLVGAGVVRLDLEVVRVVLHVGRPVEDEVADVLAVIGSGKSAMLYGVNVCT